jgi:Zn-dependent peptidase ImmA (M78 family)
MPDAAAARHRLPDEVYNPVELAAETFATEVLMPTDEVKQRHDAGHTLRQLAPQFVVNDNDMHRRLQDLGL